MSIDTSMSTGTSTTSASTSSESFLWKSVSDSAERRWAHRLGIESLGYEQDEIAGCRKSVVHWVNHWVWTFDPREPIATIPFDLFPCQESFLRWLADRETRREDGLVEKSRDMGVTWLCCAYALHGWMFRPGYAVGFGSRKLDLVDSIGDPDCIFEKFRIILRNLPDWMLPEGFRWNVHDCHARLSNPANGSTITGEGGDDIGRGGRKSIYFVDEAARIQHPQLIEASLSATTNVRIDVSTPNGPGNPFAQKRFGGKVPVFTLHWRQDPRRDDAWYEKIKAIKDAVTVAQEYDIDYAASIEGICIPAAWVRAAVNLELPEVPGRQVTAGWDVASEGSDKNVVISRAGPLVDGIVSWSGLNSTPSAWRAVSEAEKLGVAVLNYDCLGVGDGVKGLLQNTSRRIPFKVVPVNVGDNPTDNRHEDGKTAKEKFKNLRAEIWWNLRRRFERAYEYAELLGQGTPEAKTLAKKINAAEMISIPNHPELIAQLSLPLVEYTDTGLIQLESKKKMRERGVRSPDFGDALALAFHEERKLRAQLW